jgi:hypothetical protein
MKRILIGVDLAKSFDFTSFSVIEMEDSVYHLVGLDRVRGVEYPKITELILATVGKLDNMDGVDDGPHLCLDASGLGAPIKDFLKGSGKFASERKQIFPVVFTGGEAARFDTKSRNYNISKSLIISNLLSLMQHHRLDYAPDLQALPLLEQEIASFKRHTSTSGRQQFDAEQGAHDDLICALAIPLIIGEWRFHKTQTPLLCFSGGTKVPAWGSSSKRSIPGGAIQSSNWVARASDDMVRAHRQL